MARSSSVNSKQRVSSSVGCSASRKNGNADGALDGIRNEDGGELGAPDECLDIDGTHEEDKLGTFVAVGDMDGMPLGDWDTDGLALGCDDGSVDTDGTPEGSLDGASDVEGDELG